MNARLLLGLLLLAASAGLGAHAHGARDAGLAPDEPVALALAPLGPVKALLSAGLWTAYLEQEIAGRTEEVRLLAEALLELHPDLDAVRSYLATQLIVTEAPRAADRARHEALLVRGFEMLEEGLVHGDSSRLHGDIGALLWMRQDVDPYLTRVVERLYGEVPEEVAIDHLRRADGRMARELLAKLLVRRGVYALVDHDDVEQARRDLREAEDVVAQLGAATARGDGRDGESHESHDGVLAPLREALQRSGALDGP